MATIRQVKTKTVTTTYIMSRASFVRGFNEARSGKPFDYDAFAGDLRNQWEYERGRLFGHIYDGDLKRGIHVTLDAQRAFISASRDGVIF